jgi:hypothetical protein
MIQLADNEPQVKICRSSPYIPFVDFSRRTATLLDHDRFAFVGERYHCQRKPKYSWVASAKLRVASGQFKTRPLWYPPVRSNQFAKTPPINLNP